MKRKGFTLIELLASIVVLAIIALIAIPVVLGIIDKAKQGSIKTSALGYIEAIEQQVAVNLLDKSKKDITDGKYDVKDLKNDYDVKVKGRAPEKGWVIIENGVVTEYNFEVDGYSVESAETDLVVAKISNDIINIPDDRMMDSYIDVAYFLPRFENLLETDLFDIENLKTNLKNIMSEDDIEKLKNQAMNQLNYFFSDDFTEGDNALDIIEIEKIKTVTSKKVPQNALDSKDISYKQNGSVMAWVMDEDNDSKLELYIGQDGGVIAPKKASFLFAILITNMINTVEDDDKKDGDIVDKIVDPIEEQIEEKTDEEDALESAKTISEKIDVIVDEIKEKIPEFIEKMSPLEEFDISNLNTKYTTDMSFMFTGVNLKSDLDLSKMDTSNATNMAGMFALTAFTNIDLKKFDTKNVTNMMGMFAGSLKLESLNVSYLNTSNVRNMAGMFAADIFLKSIDLKKFNTSNVRNMAAMFLGDVSLQSIDVSSFNTSKVKNMIGMFALDTSITSLNLSSFNTNSIINMQAMFMLSSKLKNIQIGDFVIKDPGNLYLFDIMMDMMLN